MVQETIQYVQAHPIVSGSILLAVILALVGLWYVVAHHLQAIVVTLLCAAGVGAGVNVLYRGVKLGHNDLIGIGAFLIVVFPIVYYQLVRSLKAGAPPVIARTPAATPVKVG